MRSERVFLDANILFSIAYGSPGLERLWSDAKKGEYELIASQYVIEEAKRNLDRREQQDTLDRHLSEVRVVPEADPTIPCPVPLPEKDRPVMMAALSCKADYLITGDVTHFGKYFGKKIRTLRICTPRGFFNIISRLSP
ncbi:MAG: putative nucleic acid-binding protein, contains domain [Deltaproteobacteria bacterium]|nr:putative nucleic acid-binding protein, contains domain [Deltaproteobacteria bacterium]